jgi:hypothetical protein
MHQVGGVRRESGKIQPIVSMNPAWRDLSEEWYTRHRYQPQTA